MPDTYYCYTVQLLLKTIKHVAHKLFFRIKMIFGFDSNKQTKMEILIIHGVLIVKGSQWEGPKVPVLLLKESPSLEQNKLGCKDEVVFIRSPRCHPPPLGGYVILTIT